MTLVNALQRLMTVTDVKVAGVSVFADIRHELLKMGRLEDADDELTLLPGESLMVVVPDDDIWEMPRGSNESDEQPG